MSDEPIRQRIDDIDSSLKIRILQANIDIFKTCHPKSTPLSNSFVMVNIDVSPFDNSRTAKKVYLEPINNLMDTFL